MNSYPILSVLALILIVSIPSDASSSRVLMAEEKPNTEKVSPTTAPISQPIPKELNQKPQTKSAESNSNPLEVAPTRKSGDNGKNKDEDMKESKNPPKKENKGPSGEEIPTVKKQVEKCDESISDCRVHEDLVACLQHSKIADSKELVLLVQNVGGNTLDVKITAPQSIRIDKILNLSKDGSSEFNLSADATKSLKIVLNAGNGDCVIQIGPLSSNWNLFQDIPAYASQLTPIYGIYFLFFTLVIAGGVWGCCKFGRRGRRAAAGVPYQQLEMGAQTQTSTGVVAASTADGWDQGWDDDWDVEEATRPSNTVPNGNVSSNGLSSRSANKKNDWDINWDD